MIVACDMGPLHYLILIGADHILPGHVLPRPRSPKVVMRRR